MWAKFSLSNMIPNIHLDWITVTGGMSAFDTNKPAGICSFSMETPVSEPVQGFVDFISLLLASLHA